MPGKLGFLSVEYWFLYKQLEVQDKVLQDLGGTTISAGLVNAEGTLLGIASEAQSQTLGTPFRGPQSGGSRSLPLQASFLCRKIFMEALLNIEPT